MKAGAEVSVQKDTIRAKLKEYRVTICLADQHGILFGIKIATGIADCLIDKIINSLSMCTIEFSLQLGLPHQHTMAMHDVVDVLNN